MDLPFKVNQVNTMVVVLFARCLKPPFGGEAYIQQCYNKSVHDDDDKNK